MTAMTMCIFNLESWPKLMAGYKRRVLELSSYSLESPNDASTTVNSIQSQFKVNSKVKFAPFLAS